MTVFQARIKDYHGDAPDDGWSIDASSAQDAAELAAKRYNETSDPMGEDDTCRVLITDADGSETGWTVSVGLITTYRARRDQGA